MGIVFQFSVGKKNASFSILSKIFLILAQNNAAYCTSEMFVFKNNEIHLWDRGYDDDGNQVGSYGDL